MRLKKLKVLLIVSCLGIIVMTLPPVIASYPVVVSSEIDPSVAQIAKQVTVRILTGSGAGSGVILTRRGDTYTAITNAHVVDSSKKYSVLTVDGRTYSAYLWNTPNLREFDLAVVKFKSSRSYQVAEFNHSTPLEDIAIEDIAYASGFPNEIGENTLNWGLRAYRFTMGKVSMLLLDKSLAGGYRLGYTNDIEIGMSGGPVLNRQGKLIGINGWSKYPLSGIAVFHYTDGTIPSIEVFERMESLSWAIPVSTFSQEIN